MSYSIGNNNVVFSMESSSQIKDLSREVPCKFFFGKNGCKFGNWCRFSHNIEGYYQSLDFMNKSNGALYLQKEYDYNNDNNVVSIEKNVDFLENDSENYVESDLERSDDDVREEVKQDFSVQTSSQQNHRSQAIESKQVQQQTDELHETISLHPSRTSESSIETQASGAVEQCMKLKEKFLLQGKEAITPCKNYPLCKYTSEGHIYCFPCFHQRQIDYHKRELELTKAVCEAKPKLD